MNIRFDSYEAQDDLTVALLLESYDSAYYSLHYMKFSEDYDGCLHLINCLERVIDYHSRGNEGKEKVRKIREKYDYRWKILEMGNANHTESN